MFAAAFTTSSQHDGLFGRHGIASLLNMRALHEGRTLPPTQT
jgi:hypothetical protein